MNLPPNISLNALRAFEAVARTGSITAAASSLGVTHGAVSRQIKQLEGRIGTALLSGPRHQRKLTAEGQQLATACTTGFQHIETVLDDLMQSGTQLLDIACLSSFAIRWLIPRLSDLAQIAPELDIRLSTRSGPDIASAPRTDLIIMVLPRRNLVSSQDTMLFDEHLGPVISPHLWSQDRSLVALPHLRAATRPDAGPLWSELAGHDIGQWKSGSSFAHVSQAIEAAASGLGHAVVPRHLVRDDLTSGRLIAPFGFTPSGFVYVARVQGRPSRAARQFRDWLLAQSRDEHT